MDSYKVGLQHVGSYISSGRPFMKTNASLSDGDTEYIKFPNVTKKIRVKNHSTSGALKIGFADNARRAYNMPDGTGFLETSFANATSLTVSFWMKPLYVSPQTSVLRILQLGSTALTRLQGTGTGGLRFFVDNAPFNSSDNLYSSGNWSQITVVIDGSNNKVYVDGELAITNTTAAPISGFSELSIGADATNFDDIYDEMYLFNVALTPEEVTELYAEGTYFDPRNHSQSENLVSWWTFEDNGYRTYFPTGDTITSINDRVGSNNLAKQGGGTGTFVNGRQLDKAIDSHSLILSPGAEIELDVKTKSMFLFSDGATQNFDVYASLTNIHSERMYDLTGPGIDE